jgi:hypothetical protein
MAVAISAHTRKILWAQAAGRCAKCRRHLVESATDHDDEAIVGEECHVISAAPGGPRHAQAPAGGYDHADNLLLLCRVCHRVVDAQPAAHPSDALRTLKAAHARWVADRLRDGRLPRMTFTPLPDKVELDLIASGRQLLELVDGPHDSRFDHDEPRDDDEAELIARTMDTLNDWGMIVGDLGPGERLRVARELQSLLVDELLPARLVIYGTVITRKLICDGEASPWRSAIVVIRHARRAADAQAA